MEIRFIKGASGIGLAYTAGETADLKETLAKELIESGFAEEILPKPAKANPIVIKTAEDAAHENAETAAKK
jgi:hypothetical protein